MRSAAFSFALLIVVALSVWLGLRLIITTDPDQTVNVVLFGFALFLAVGSLGALAAWVLWARHWQAPKGYQVALRQGIWLGLLVATITLLQVWQMLSWLAVGAIVLILGGLEALLLLQPDPSAIDEPQDAQPTP